MHNLPYAGHPGYHKTITVVRGQYFWPGMKKYVIDYLAICMECQKVKVEQKHITLLLYLFPIPEWKWGIFIIDFITKFPRITWKHNSIMVVVEKITNDGHCISVKIAHKVDNIVENYMREIVRRHGVPKEIV